MWKRPFIYAYDFSTGNFPNSSYQDLLVPIDGGLPFDLRRVVGIQTVLGTNSVGSYQIKRAGVPRSSSAFRAFTPDWPFVPELSYDAAGTIQFDITMTNGAPLARAFVTEPLGGGLPIYQSQLAFQGVSKYASLTPPSTVPTKPYIYTAQVTLTQPALNVVGGVLIGRNLPTRLTIPIEQQFDFELMAISYNPVVLGSFHDVCALSILDASQNPISNIPINGSFINYNTQLFGTFPCWPIPPMVYPTKSVIAIDVYSLLPSSQVPLTINFLLIGANRLS